jgi:hypothetical protein
MPSTLAPPPPPPPEAPPPPPPPQEPLAGTPETPVGGGMPGDIGGTPGRI